MKRILLGVLIVALAIGPAFASQWDKTKIADTTYFNDVDAVNQANNDALDRVLAGYRQGMALQYSSASALTVAAGEIIVADSNGIKLMLRNTSSTSVGWADIDAGGEASSTTYYVYALAASAAVETATFKISTNSSAPAGVTYYKRLGSFFNNSGSDIEQISNDNSNVLVAQGTIASGATISLPSGYGQDQCKWMVGFGTIGVASGGDGDNLEYLNCVTDSARAVTCRAFNRSVVYITGTANYIIVCNR